MIWCYVDESWHEGANGHIGVLAGVIGHQKDFEDLGRTMFAIRRKYFGVDHARDMEKELKGRALFSRISWKSYDRGFSRNMTVAREILEYMMASKLRVIGITVYGQTKPKLLSTHSKYLDRPFKELCIRGMAYVPAKEKGYLVFDQRFGAHEGISIAVENYLAGIPPPQSFHTYPLLGVSNCFPGLQAADIVAYILARYNGGDDRYQRWYNRISKMQVTGTGHTGNRVYGLVRLDDLGNATYHVRRNRG